MLLCTQVCDLLNISLRGPKLTKTCNSMVELDAWRIFISTGGTPDSILHATQEQNSLLDLERGVVNTTFNFKHRWICAQCYKNGQIVERKGRTLYCSSRGSHSWRDPMLYCYIGITLQTL